MKRILCILTVIALLCMLLPLALAEGTWTCAQCGRENAADFAFCPGCAAARPEENKCPACGFEMPEAFEGYAFCPKCGAQMKPEAAGPETPEAAADPAEDELTTLVGGDPTAIGSIVTFGHYEQDNDPDNGQEPIEWIVLEYDDAGKEVTLLSRYCLEGVQFDKGEFYPTWAKSGVRQWLNSHFLHTAFTADEEALISIKDISTPDYHANEGGEDSQDKVWLMSIDELITYYPEKADRIACPTAYAVANGAYIGRDGETWWWLRSPGFAGIHHLCLTVYSTGKTRDYWTTKDFVTVRPVLVVDLDAHPVN